MASEPVNRIEQWPGAGRDSYTAGRDLILNEAPVGDDPVVPGLLPRDVPGFTGREDELARLGTVAGGGRVVVTAIGGTAGAGKTALAVHAAHRLLPGFPDGHLYADLRGYTADQAPAEPSEVLEMFLRCLGVAADDVPEGTEERSGLLRGLLASRRVLVLLDNARTEVQVEPLLPGAGESLVLVTSRSPLPGLAADARLMLNALPDADAARLLTELAGKNRVDAEPEATAKVRAYCGGLPLALRIVGHLLATHPPWPVSKLERMLSDEQDRLERLQAGDLQVRAAFEVSYRQLGRADARMFRLLGLNPAPDFGPAPAAALAGITKAEAESSLGRLAEAFLITEDQTDRYGMHDLLRLFARDTCHAADSKAERDAAETRLITWYADRARFLNSCIDPKLRPAAKAAGRDDAVLPSPREALALFSAEWRGLMAAASLAARSEQDNLLMHFSESVGEAMIILRFLDDLLFLCQTALAAARRARDTAGEGKALNNLGIVYRRLRRFEEAVNCHEQALTMHREIGDRHGEGKALGSLGVAYRNLGRFEEAAISHEQALTIHREIGDRHGEGRTLNNLGNAYWGLGRFEEAVACHEQALTICREVGDRHGEGMTLNNLGNAYRDRQRLEEAVTCYEQDIAICRETGDRHGEGRTLSNLGLAYQDLQQHGRAAACWRDAAVAMREAGDEKRAAYLEQLASDASSVRPRRWLRLRRH